MKQEVVMITIKSVRNQETNSNKEPRFQAHLTQDTFPRSGVLTTEKENEVFRPLLHWLTLPVYWVGLGRRHNTQTEPWISMYTSNFRFMAS